MRKIHLVLASASPRRKELLQTIGVSFEIVPADIKEIMMRDESPISHVKRLSLEKAQKVSKKMPQTWVLGADTIVVKDGKVLGKPKDEKMARYMLKLLSGTDHKVYTGYAIIHSDFPAKKIIRCVKSDVYIRPLGPDEIDSYIKTGEPMDKAGGYAVQGLGSAIVKKISGSYTNVVGLPLCEVAQDLKDLEIFDFLGG